MIHASAGPPHRLGHDVHAAIAGDDVVFLALSADRYFCLPGGARRLTLSTCRTRISTGEAVLVEDLRTMALLCPEAADPCTARPALPALPSKDVAEGDDLAFAFRDLPAAVHCLGDALFHYRGRALADLVRLQGSRVHPPTTMSAALIAEVRRYRRMARWLPLPRKCLLQSFLLLRHLRRQGLDAQWVFAARTWPFEAHCWLQVEDVVLDDHHERLVAFAPLMVA